MKLYDICVVKKLAMQSEISDSAYRTSNSTWWKRPRARAPRRSASSRMNTVYIVCVYIHLSLSLSIYIYIYIPLSLYIYIYIYKYINIYMYMYIYISTCGWRGGVCWVGGEESRLCAGYLYFCSWHVCQTSRSGHSYGQAPTPHLPNPPPSGRVEDVVGVRP